MGIKTILESTVVGLAAQVIVGWITPFTLVFTGLVAGIVSRDEREGTISGFIVGLLVGAGFVIRWYLRLGITYTYPAAEAVTRLGDYGVYIVALIMILLGVVGGRVGGSIMQRAMNESYSRGKTVGEGKRIAGSYERKDGERKRRRVSSDRLYYPEIRFSR
jgi:uncharacterized membrane protein